MSRNLHGRVCHMPRTGSLGLDQRKSTFLYFYEYSMLFVVVYHVQVQYIVFTNSFSGQVSQINVLMCIHCTRISPYFLVHFMFSFHLSPKLSKFLFNFERLIPEFHYSDSFEAFKQSIIAQMHFAKVCSDLQEATVDEFGEVGYKRQPQAVQSRELMLSSGRK